MGRIKNSVLGTVGDAAHGFREGMRCRNPGLGTRSKGQGRGLGRGGGYGPVGVPVGRKRGRRDRYDDCGAGREVFRQGNFRNLGL